MAKHNKNKRISFDINDDYDSYDESHIVAHKRNTDSSLCQLQREETHFDRYDRREKFLKN